MNSKLLRVWCSGLTLLASLAVGCQSQRAGHHEFAWWTTTRKDTDKANLTQPEQTQLAYAHWQEQVGQLAEARETYKKVLRLDPKSAEGILGLARLDERAGRSREAEEGFQKALKLKPNDPDVLVSVGQFYGSRKQWNKAVELLNKATTAAPENTRARYNLAVALARAGNTEAAMPHFVKTVGEASAHYNVGYILYEQGKLGDAETQLAIAMAQKPDMQQAHDILQKIRGGAHGDQSLLAKRAAGVIHPAGVNADSEKFFKPGSSGAEYQVAGSSAPATSSGSPVSLTGADDVPNWASPSTQVQSSPVQQIPQRRALEAATAGIPAQSPVGRASVSASNPQPLQTAPVENSLPASQAMAAPRTIDAPAPLGMIEPLDDNAAGVPLESGTTVSDETHWRRNVAQEGRASTRNQDDLAEENTYFEPGVPEQENRASQPYQSSDFKKPLIPQWKHWQAAPNSSGVGDNWQPNGPDNAAAGNTGWTRTSDFVR